MRHANTIQWAVIGIVLAIGLAVWFKPKSGDRPPPPPPTPFSSSNIVESVSPNQVLVGVAPLRFLMEGSMNKSALRELTSRAFTAANDIISGIDGVVVARSANPEVEITMAVSDLHDEARKFSGYGVEINKSVSQCFMKVQVINASTKQVYFSQTIEGERGDSHDKVSSITRPALEREVDAITSALQTLASNEDFRKAIFRVKATSVEVEFSPKPDNCDIEIDARYIGSSPVKQTLLSGQNVKVRISKAGFQSWERDVSPQNGLRVSPELEAINPGK